MEIFPFFRVFLFVLSSSSSSFTCPFPYLLFTLHPLRGDPLIGLCVLVNFDRRRVEHDSFLTAAAAILAPVAPPPVLADAAAAALLAPAAPPPVLAEAAAAAVLALAALPTVLTKAATAALLAPAAPPPVLADAAAAAVLAIVAMPPVRADAAAAALLAEVALPTVRTLRRHLSVAASEDGTRARALRP